MMQSASRPDGARVPQGLMANEAGPGGMELSPRVQARSLTAVPRVVAVSGPGAGPQRLQDAWLRMNAATRRAARTTALRRLGSETGFHKGWRITRDANIPAGFREPDPDGTRHAGTRRKMATGNWWAMTVGPEAWSSHSRRPEVSLERGC